MRISSTQPSLVMRAEASQKKSGEESSPMESSDTASYWMPRGLARRRRPVLPSLRVSRITPP